jgi:transposase
MRKATKLELKSEEKEGLEQCFRWHPSAAVRSRCQLILLKAQGRTADDIAAIVNMCVISVHSWIKRYGLEGLNGLLTKAGVEEERKFSEQKKMHPSLHRGSKSTVRA